MSKHTPVDADMERLQDINAELLHSLKGLARAYISLCEETGKQHHKVNGSWLSHAHAAIAKATGEKP